MLRKHEPPGTLERARRIAKNLGQYGLKIQSIHKDGPADDPKINVRTLDHEFIVSVGHTSLQFTNVEKIEYRAVDSVRNLAYLMSVQDLL